jgi:hypothetical protein
VDAGYEWSVIANSHLARTLADYPVNYGTSGCNYDPPNRADIVNTNGENWWNGQIDGRGGAFAAPYCYQAHHAQYVNPENGTLSQMIVVPMADLLSYQNGYGTMGTSEIDAHIAPFSDSEHPAMILLAHDGDNAWGGGYSYYGESVPGFANEAASKGYVPSTIQQFLHDNPVPSDDIVKVEDGSWFNADNDWGHPQFINWLWPLIQNGQFDAEGWTEDARNWAVLTAAENIVETAEDLSPAVRIPKIVQPDGSATHAERAWHHLLPGYTSGYMYYGASLDMEVKPTLAANLSHKHAMKAINTSTETDATPPTIFIPQRFPWNPGGEGFGPLYSYQVVQQPSDFHIWTFVYDVSGLESVTLKIRSDEDGLNPINDIANETYSGGSGVSEWQSIEMTHREFPVGNVTGNPEINFFILPNAIADLYYAEVSGFTETLLDYYVEAVDHHGNVKKSPIQHVWVGEYHSGGGGEDYVFWEPTEPAVEDTLRIWYGQDGMLFNADPLYLHHGINGWQSVQDDSMHFSADSNAWYLDLPLANHISVVDFVFTNLNGAWDNNSGQDWHVNIAGSGGGEGFVMDGQLDSGANLLLEDSQYKIYAAENDGEVYIAVEPPTGSSAADCFVFLAETPGSMAAAPWAKSGQVAQWELYLAREGSNGWCGWSDHNGSAVAFSTANLLEGTFNLSAEGLESYENLHFAVTFYSTSDGGGLNYHLPNNGTIDGNLTADEYYRIGDGYQFLSAKSNFPKEFILLPPYPNPFNAETTLRFTIPQQQKVSLILYDLSGKKLMTLLAQNLDAGTYSIRLDARALASGLYLVQLQGNKLRHSQKLVIIK